MDPPTPPTPPPTSSSTFQVDQHLPWRPPPAIVGSHGAHGQPPTYPPSLFPLDPALQSQPALLPQQFAGHSSWYGHPQYLASAPSSLPHGYALYQGGPLPPSPHQAPFGQPPQPLQHTYPFGHQSGAPSQAHYSQYGPPPLPTPISPVTQEAQILANMQAAIQRRQLDLAASGWQHAWPRHTPVLEDQHHAQFEPQQHLAPSAHAMTSLPSASNAANTQLSSSLPTISSTRGDVRQHRPPPSLTQPIPESESVSATPLAGRASLSHWHTPHNVAEEDSTLALSLASPEMAERTSASIPLAAESSNTPTHPNSALESSPMQAFDPGSMPPPSTPFHHLTRSQSMPYDVSSLAAASNVGTSPRTLKRRGTFQGPLGYPNKRGSLSPITPFSSPHLRHQGGASLDGILASPETTVFGDLPLHVSPDQFQHMTLPSTVDGGYQTSSFSNDQHVDQQAAMPADTMATPAPSARQPSMPMQPPPSAQSIAGGRGGAAATPKPAGPRKKKGGLQTPYPELSSDDRLKRMLGYEDGDELLTITDISCVGWKSDRTTSSILGGLLRPSPPTLVLIASTRYAHIRATVPAALPFLHNLSFGACRVSTQTKLVCPVNGAVFQRYLRLDDSTQEEWEWRPMDGMSRVGEITIRGPRDPIIALNNRLGSMLAAGIHAARAAASEQRVSESPAPAPSDSGGNGGRGRSVSVATGIARLAVASTDQPTTSTLPQAAVLVSASGGVSALPAGDARDEARPALYPSMSIETSASVNRSGGRHDSLLSPDTYPSNDAEDDDADPAAEPMPMLPPVTYTDALALPGHDDGLLNDPAGGLGANMFGAGDYAVPDDAMDTFDADLWGLGLFTDNWDRADEPDDGDD